MYNYIIRGCRKGALRNKRMRAEGPAQSLREAGLINLFAVRVRAILIAKPNVRNGTF